MVLGACHLPPLLIQLGGDPLNSLRHLEIRDLSRYLFSRCLLGLRVSWGWTTSSPSFHHNSSQTPPTFDRNLRESVVFLSRKTPASVHEVAFSVHMD